MTVMRAQIKNCTWVVLAVECIFEVQKVDEQWDAAKPSIDRPVLEICYLLGLADPGRSHILKGSLYAATNCFLHPFTSSRNLGSRSGLCRICTSADSCLIVQLDGS